jgi:hypothetical protein
MAAHRTYTLVDLEGALGACNRAITQTRRGYGGPILTLDELKNDAEALTVLVTRARAESSQTLGVHEIGELLPRLAYWHQRNTGTPPKRSKIIKIEGGSA